MTTAEAIEYFETRKLILAEINLPGLESCNKAIEALREKRERENPKLLTIDELSRMHGEPVWVTELEQWAIVEVDTTGTWAGKPFANGISFNKDIERRKLHCYRHKPKEETVNGKSETV